MNALARTGILIVIFSVAMAALEAAVVVYLRELYYPDVFTVNFKLVDENIVMVEIVREMATLVMLAAIGYIAGKRFKDRLAWFLLSFAIWDIFYYAWLKVFIDWPSTFLDWDILFLIPITWIGPVAAPLICSFTMIVLGLVLLRWDPSIPKKVWALILGGVVLILFTFIRDYAALIIAHDLIAEFPNLLHHELFLKKAAELVPKPYLWSIFWMGQGMLLAGIFLLLKNRGLRSEKLSTA